MRDARVEGRVRVLSEPGDRRPLTLDRLRALPRLLPAPEPLDFLLPLTDRGVPEVARDLVRVEQVAGPGELPVPRPDPRLGVDPELELPEEVVLVARHRLDHPELPLRDDA